MYSVHVYTPLQLGQLLKRLALPYIFSGEAKNHDKKGGVEVYIT